MTAAALHLRRAIPLLVLLCLWEVAVDASLVNSAFLPPVHQVAAAFWQLVVEGEMWSDLLISAYRALGGLALGAVAGVGLGLLMATSRRANGFFGPLVAATYSLPKAALVPLFVLWFGVGDTTNMLTVFLSSLLPVVVNTYHGVKAVPHTLVWSARAFGTPFHRILTRVLLPASAPHILTGVRIALGFSWVLTLSAEMIAAKSGIGKLVFQYGENGAYAFMFAGIAAIVILAFAMDRLMVLMTGRLLQWHESSQAREAA
jgi:ABC-type nitrate/sulfonate/bicarbonate transport system permease component